MKQSACHTSSGHEAAKRRYCTRFQRNLVPSKPASRLADEKVSSRLCFSGTIVESFDMSPRPL
eukprot:1008307-Pleurochrysis_carterae.AAC.1